MSLQKKDVSNCGCSQQGDAGDSPITLPWPPSLLHHKREGCLPSIQNAVTDKGVPKEPQAGQRSVHLSEDDAPMLLLQLLHCTWCWWRLPTALLCHQPCDLPAPCSEEPTDTESQRKLRNPQLRVSKSLGLSKGVTPDGLRATWRAGRAT